MCGVQMRRLAAALALAPLPAASLVPQASPLAELQHVNLNVPAWTPALESFWFDTLGFARDPRDRGIFKQTVGSGGTMKDLIWANIGLQQLHMPVGEPSDGTQLLRGKVGLAFEDLEALRGRLRSGGVDFEESAGGAAAERFGPALELRSPTGVQLRAHAAAGIFGPAEATAAGVSQPGGPSLGTGLPYVELLCGVGAAASICRFYQQLLGVPAELGQGFCHVPIQRQALLFVETASELPLYDGHHIAVYAGNVGTGDATESFAAMYRRCQAAGLVYNNPRFPHLSYDTLEDALRHSEFRVMQLVDPGTGEAAYTLEHEIRSLEHPGFSCRSLLAKKSEL